LLAEIAEIIPALALELASPLHHKEFKLTDEQQKRYAEYRRRIATEYIAEMRAKAASNGHDTQSEEQGATR